MRYAVLADVHANLPALRATVGAARREGVDGFLCPGDLVGYGPQPNECVELIAGLGAECVAGNHDLVALGRLEPARCTALARDSLRWTSRVLRADTRRFLTGLPARLDLAGLTMAHGSPDDVEEYVRGEQWARAVLAGLPDADRRIVLLGHTHEPWAFASRRGTLLRRTTGARVLADEAHLLNPAASGSPGTPARTPATCCSILRPVSPTSARSATTCPPAGPRCAARGLPEGSCHLPPPIGERARRPLGRVKASLLRAAANRPRPPGPVP